MSSAHPLEAPSPERLTDEEIVRRVVGGDSAIFELVVRRHNQRIYRTVRAVLGRDDEVEDVMQQAYLKAFEHISQFAGDAQLSTWLTKIALNEALDRRRKRNRFFNNENDEAIMELPDTKLPDPEQQATTTELREVLECEIAALPEAFRIVLVLRDVEGMTTSEAASCLEISEDLVKTRLHRGRVMLREKLYRRAGVTMESLFSFGDSRCDRVVAAVMESISLRER